MLFRYSGSKGKYLDRYRSPPPGTQRIVEPYLGSGAYSLNHSACGAIGFDNSPNVAGLWRWLMQATSDGLERLPPLLAAAKAEMPKPDIRHMDLDEGARLYLKINVCGLVVGQWSSWKVYPQHYLPVAQTLEALPQLRRFVVQQAPADAYDPREGDMVFVDPPYIRTSGNYGTEKGYDPKQTRSMLDRCWGLPIIFTYGTGAPEIFPGLPWQVVRTALVPNVRCGGTVPRTEYVAYLNWPSEV